MDEPGLLGIDLGTSSVKAVLIDRAGRERGHGRAGYELTRIGEGGVEMDPAVWWQGVRAAVVEATAAAPLVVAAIGLSGQMHGIVVLDQDRRVLRPAVTWLDSRSIPLVPWVERLSTPFARSLVNPATAGFAATTMAWLRQAEPAVAARTAMVLQPKDWLGHVLTGRLGTEPSDASATGLWDFGHGSWHSGLTRALGYPPNVLPDVHPSDDTRGPLRSGVADELGLPRGIPVSFGLADTAASLIGAGTEAASGTTTLTMGSGAQICQVIPHRPTTPLSGLVVLAGPRDGEHYLMAGVFSGGLALDWARRQWSLSWPDFLDRAGHPPGSRDPLFVPFLAGERMIWSGGGLRACWADVQAEHGVTELVRAAVNGVLYTLRLGLDLLRRDPQTGPVSEIVVSGGAVRSPVLRQRLADVLGIPVISADVSGSSVRGAALSAAVAAGWCASTGAAQSLLSLPLERVEPSAAKDRDAHEYARFVGLVDTLRDRGAS